eukprot:8897258-Ditylum_brightwellii.AAC.1
MRANIKLHKLELGTGTSLFATNYNMFQKCCTPTWISWTWGFLCNHNCIIKETTPNLKKLREND